ncbi:CheR family methyltransferase [Novosphingobium sp. UBA1939]|uniref:CheR family methyltransferase n=1 Tax=Novosphingobium sp. UBA1939 TaxID=1946982 RepID=UPI0025FB070E|nr:protein-glutamate O-methyltransferase CheR [Novosphingobium sp. UBA1939]
MSAAHAGFAEPLPGISPAIYSVVDFRALSDIAYAHAGIILPEGKAMLVYSRLAPLVRETGCGSFGNYVARLRTDAAEEARAVAALTTNHTFFYREPHHFAHFAEQVRPALVASLEAGRGARLWSAGCSSGEETWSLAMTLLGSEPLAGRRLAGRDLKMLATDLAPHVLRQAEAATYPAKDLEPVPQELRRCWTQEADGMATFSDLTRALVRFRILNLLGPWPMRHPFDVIFCRNVMIYFDAETKEQLVARFADALAPGGYLYIGHSERVTGPAARILRPVGPTIYRKAAA